MTTRSETWTTRKLLNWTAEHLERKGIDSPRLSAELMMAHVLGVPRVSLYTDLDRPASELERAAYRDLVERAAAHEPVQYLTGEAHFFSMTFEVTADTLIPRPSTETLVEHAIHHARHTPGFRQPIVADIGTGSGCIACAIAKHLDGSQVIATDVSEAALAVAGRNAERHGVADRIDFRCGWLYDVLGERVNLLCSNPPYIPDNEWADVAPNVADYEPTGALRAGVDGLDVLRPLIAGAADRLLDGGRLAFEIAASQKQAVLALAGEPSNLADARVLADAEGHPRVLVADRR